MPDHVISFPTSWLSPTFSISSQRVFASVREIIMQTTSQNNLLSEMPSRSYACSTCDLRPVSDHTFCLHRLLPLYDSVTVNVGIYHTYLLRGSAPHGFALRAVQ